MVQEKGVNLSDNCVACLLVLWQNTNLRERMRNFLFICQCYSTAISQIFAWVPYRTTRANENHKNLVQIECGSKCTFVSYRIRRFVAYQLNHVLPMNIERKSPLRLNRLYSRVEITLMIRLMISSQEYILVFELPIYCWNSLRSN